MRIIAGSHRGRKLAPLGKGDVDGHLRPTTDRVRESLFNVLMGGRFGDPVSGAYVLDLFAGTGALGLEALSRGAAFVTFVDNGKKAQSLIRENIALCQAQDTTHLLTRDARRLPPHNAAPCGLIFIDPPYGRDLGQIALTEAQKGGWIAAGALIVWEESTAQEPPVGFSACDQRVYGDTVVSFLRSA